LSAERHSGVFPPTRTSAVDPAFKLSARSRRLADAKVRPTHYLETTSNAFVANETVFLEQQGIEVAWASLFVVSATLPTLRLPGRRRQSDQYRGM
jgi:hypothetical protein